MRRPCAISLSPVRTSRCGACWFEPEGFMGSARAAPTEAVDEQADRFPCALDGALDRAHPGLARLWGWAGRPEEVGDDVGDVEAVIAAGDRPLLDLNARARAEPVDDVVRIVASVKLVGR